MTTFIDTDEGLLVTEQAMFVSIPLEEYAELLKDGELLHALFAAGVDGWDGYEIALESLDDRDDG